MKHEFLTASAIAEIEVREKAATDDPWLCHDDEYCPEEIWGGFDGPDEGRIHATHICTMEDYPNAGADGSFIRKARVDVRRLLADLAACKALLAECEWDSDVDCGAHIQMHCSICGSENPVHEADCRLAAALGKGNSNG